MFQDMAICDAKGRDCIERNSSKTFHCNTTCVGIYADVQWIGKNIVEELKDDEGDGNIKYVSGGKMGDDLQLQKVLLLFKTEIMNHMHNEMKLFKDEMKNDFEDMMKMVTGQRGEELDKRKYKMLVSEYRKFKTKNVKHFRFNAAANLSEFGESCLSSDNYE